MAELFGAEYAHAYDALYEDKDYEQESRLIDSLLRSHGQGRVASVLDLGCGTGNHAWPLANLGYEVLGVDRSSAMLESARTKARRWQPDGKAAFDQGDIRTFQTARSFDASLMMFAVLGYQLENADVLAALRTARKHTRVEGLLIFDAWYGPAVLRQGPSERLKVIPTETGQILRAATGELDVAGHLCTVSYRLWRFEGERLAGQAEETHRVRYFFPLELRLFLECSGFELLRLGAFPAFERDADATTWNILGLARAA